jgi:UTP--glucose-1-phosphate uridylyltransferase
VLERDQKLSELDDRADALQQGAISDVSDFQSCTKRDAKSQLVKDLDRLLQTAQPQYKEQSEKELDSFKKLYSKFLEDDGAKFQWEKIEKLPEDSVRDYKNLEAPKEHQIADMLKKLVVVKLNGGLGTSMGCQGPKSVIAVRKGLTFLDLTVQQIKYLNNKYSSNVPLVLMNSFNTDEETKKVLQKYRNLDIRIETFNQSCYPRIHRESHSPIARNYSIEDDQEAWYPPGHGDFYASFAHSGLLNRFLSEGYEYCFISNIDNLGATVDLNILKMLINAQNRSTVEFLIEVTDKTRADVKGGTLIQYEGKLRLLEIAQVPKQHVDEFKSIKTFKIFNTNNLWIRMDAIKRAIDENTLDMEVIVNPKTVKNGVNVLQLETAVGAAMKSFDNCIGLNVPRSRFLPVKKTQDLLLLKSNLYLIENGSLKMNPLRSFSSTPFIKLGDNQFAKVADFLRRFETIPDILELDHLTVSGDVTFGHNVSLKGTVIIIANHGKRIDIPSCTLLENKIVTGNLRILDH